MFETLNLEYVRKRVHGDDSSLTFLKEADTSFESLTEITSDFAITSQRDVAEGSSGLVDKLTARLTANTQAVIDFNKAHAISLRMGELTYRYALENKAPVRPQPNGTLICQATVRAIFNDATALT